MLCLVFKNYLSVVGTCDQTARLGNGSHIPTDLARVSTPCAQSWGAEGVRRQSHPSLEEPQSGVALTLSGR